MDGIRSRTSLSKRNTVEILALSINGLELRFSCTEKGENNQEISSIYASKRMYKPLVQRLQVTSCCYRLLSIRLPILRSFCNHTQRNKSRTHSVPRGGLGAVALPPPNLQESNGTETVMWQPKPEIFLYYGSMTVGVKISTANLGFANAESPKIVCPTITITTDH